ncbi:MAG: undecaprenyl-diphosphate phosphatase [Deltaproteobacteria bacterium]|nr:undecaprenyl-diphosphate phosphatase [Deltaproteobacteria bacterium]
MELTQAIVLALVQGLTEFLPISSTAHLILVPYAANWPDQGLAFDVALNTATWLAVLVYFRNDAWVLARGFFRTIKDRGIRGNRDGELAWMVLVATIPVGIAGLLAHKYVEHELRTIAVIGVSSLVWAAALYFADRRPGRMGVDGMGWGAALIVGLSQAIALIPGTSRSGVTMTFGLFMGLSRTGAARFSYLLAIVVGGLAGGMEGVKMLKSGVAVPWTAVGIGFVIAFVSAYLVIHYFLKFLSRSSMLPFVAYRVMLGAALVAYAWRLA